MTSGVCGTGGWGGPLPGDPDNNSLLSATPAFGGIDVSWTFPQVNPHAVAHTVIYRGLISDFAGAIYLTTAAGNFFYDKSSSPLSIEYFYWIRIVSINGTVGDLIGPASAVARPTIEQTIEMLTGMIDAGVLAQSLKDDLTQISTLNTNLANEIMARENGEISLAEALASVDAGTAQALTFIAQEASSRITADSAQAESINLVAVTLGSDIAAATTTMTADIDALTGDVNAMYTAKLTVNDLVGGFGLANDGTQVEAGFDVDKFWVGRTNANKRKPFIIVGSETFIDEAVINKLTFSKLRDETGAFVVENGRVKADYLKVNNASIDGAIYSSNWDYGVSGWYLDRSGALYANSGEFRGALVGASGTFSGALSAATGTFSGTLTAGAINAVNTINLAGQAITIPVSSYTAGNIAVSADTSGVVVQSHAFTSTGAPVYVVASLEHSVGVRWNPSGEGFYEESASQMHIYRNGALLRSSFIKSGVSTIALSDTPGAGAVTYDVRLTSDAASNMGGSPTASRSLFTLETKR